MQPFSNLFTHIVSLKETTDSLSYKGSDAQRIVSVESLISNFLSHEIAGKFSLSFAERVLLIEGSQLGRADCSLPPYVEFEGEFAGNYEQIRPNYIRSEIIEWALESAVSKSLFKSGALLVIGADFITSGDLTSLTYSAQEDQQLIFGGNKFSLDLSSRDIAIDLKFEDCNFFSGINISDSYCENFNFSRCRFGSATTDQYARRGKTFSILGVNTSLKGEFTIEDQTPPLSSLIESQVTKNKKWTILNSSVDFSFARTEGQFTIRGYTSYDGEDDERKRKSTIISGDLNLQYSKMNNVILEDCTISKDLNFYSSTSSNIFLDGSVVEKAVTLTLSRFDSLFGRSSDMGEVIAAGISCDAVLLSDGAIVRRGALFYKSIIRKDFDCRGSFFGPSKEQESAGVCVSIGSSTVGNAYFSDGFFTLDGNLDLSNAVVDSTVNMRNSTIIGFWKGNKRVSIYGKHIRVRNTLSFNINPAYHQHKQSVFKNPDLILLLENNHIEYDNCAGAHNQLDKWAESDPFKERIFCELLNHRSEIDLTTSRRSGYFLGEINLEQAVIDGVADFAGAAFSNPEEGKGTNLANAINLRSAKIGGSLFLNNGILGCDLPFDVQSGDVDLQNSDINNFFLSVPSEAVLSKVKYRMAGAKYNYISHDFERKTAIHGRKLDKYLTSIRFYCGDWIHDNKKENNFRQPYEQFASALFRAGEDSRARDVLVLFRPSVNAFEWIVMLLIRFVYILTSRVYLCALTLVTLLFVGQNVFQRMHDSGQLLNSKPEIEFNALMFSAQRLIPFVEFIDKDLFYLNSGVHGKFMLYYVFHSLFGLVIFSMFLVNIARIRKGDT